MEGTPLPICSYWPMRHSTTPLHPFPCAGEIAIACAAGTSQQIIE
jgi:hypothetical protein